MSVDRPRTAVPVSRRDVLLGLTLLLAGAGAWLGLTERDGADGDATGEEDDASAEPSGSDASDADTGTGGQSRAGDRIDA